MAFKQGDLVALSGTHLHGYVISALKYATDSHGVALFKMRVRICNVEYQRSMVITSPAIFWSLLSGVQNEA